jgi:hypothetical protein
MHSLELAKAHVGPGGLGCSCCNPRFGAMRGRNAKRAKVRLHRAARRTGRMNAVREFFAALADFD